MASQTVIERAKAAAAPPETRQRQEGMVPPNSLERTYTGMGLAAGICGTLLPPVVVVGGVLLARAWSFQGSLSAYYHTGMRDVFVGMLCIVGFFLFFYRLFDPDPDNVRINTDTHNFFSIGAGIGAVTLALFPTRQAGSGSPDTLTPLQNRIGQDETFFVHIGATIVFFACLIIICYGFASQEGDRHQHREGRDATHSPTFWCRFHLYAVAGMLFGLFFIVIMWLLEYNDVYKGFITNYATLLGESVAIFAFGVSWWAKGSEFLKLKTDLSSPSPASTPA